MLTLFVVSDATGETAERVARSALTQFVDAPVQVRRRGDVRTAEQVCGVVEEAAGRDSLILHTLVADGLRRVMLEEARRRGVDAMDLMGPVLDRLTIQLGLTPIEKPGLFRQLAEQRSRQIEAVEFAFRHDDGRRVEELHRAEMVLVGVSRTMKTPTTLYLAYRGSFVANVPLVPAVPPPAPLLELPPERVFGLTMTPARLCEVRLARARHLGLTASYASLVEVREELLRAQLLCADREWRVIDVTGKSVEEVSLEVLELLRPGSSREQPQAAPERPR